jgi:formylglycine-generating enzyme required for sulfatase activity
MPDDSPSCSARDMVWIAGGTFQMGSNSHYPEEAPVHRVQVGGFFIDPYPVTNRQFAAFVAGKRRRRGGQPFPPGDAASGYRAVAERALNPADHPGAWKTAASRRRKANSGEKQVRT